MQPDFTLWVRVGFPVEEIYVPTFSHLGRRSMCGEGMRTQAGMRGSFLLVLGPGSVGEDAWIFPVRVRHEWP